MRRPRSLATRWRLARRARRCGTGRSPRRRGRRIRLRRRAWRTRLGRRRGLADALSCSARHRPSRGLIGRSGRSWSSTRVTRTPASPLPYLSSPNCWSREHPSRFARSTAPQMGRQYPRAPHHPRHGEAGQRRSRVQLQKRHCAPAHPRQGPAFAEARTDDLAGVRAGGVRAWDRHRIRRRVEKPAVSRRRGHAPSRSY